ncbi:MAG: S-layer homology domain-containing protein, partial [Chloroflexi bacterium]|nr:S-layer homology domain-containing protein [Chloroflexota bacterium]
EVTAAVKKESLPHYQTFLVTIARYEKIGVALCRENDGHLAVIKLYEGSSLTGSKILDVAGLGKVETDLANQKLVFTCANPGEVPLEYSILAGANYSQSEAGGWGSPEVTAAVKKESLPHYQTFLTAIARYESLGAAICRENDGRLAVLQLKSVQPSPTPTPTSSEPRITLIQPKGGETLLAGDSCEIFWTTINSPRLPNQVRIQFSSNGGTDWALVAIAPNNGAFSWSVPSVRTTQARIRLIWEGSQNLQTIAEDIGDNFTIALRSQELSIQKLATQDSVAAGGTITFNILVSNSGDQSLYLARVTDPLPAGTMFVAAPATMSGPEGSFDDGSGLVAWELGNLNPGDWKLLRLVVRVRPGVVDGTVIYNRALAHSARPQLTVESQDEIVVVGSKTHEAYIKGYAGDLGSTFGSQRYVSRGEIAAIIARLLHLQNTVTGQQFYSDVPPDHWTFKYVEAVHRLGIMTGFPDGTFRPDDPATRANVAVAMIRARGIDAVAFLPAAPFPDISGHWAIREIETAYVLGIIEGLPDGTFHPDAPIVRAETVTLIDRALGRGPLLEGSVIQHFPDCQPSDWFYGWGEESFQSHKGVRMASGNEVLLGYLDTEPMW